jgi:GT2 family glycosyltransferase
VTALAHPSIEVVVCTYNNAAMLDEVLAALGRQRGVDDGRWACLVVDNNCTDNTPAVVDRHQHLGLIPNLRRIREEVQGLTPARLRGARSSEAPWVAYVDDDCVLEPDWIAEAVAFVDRHPAAGAFGGKVILDYEREPEPYVHGYAYSFAAQDHGMTERRVPFLVGAGLVVSTEALAACGWSDGPLVADRIGNQLVSGGDVEIVLRVASAGYELWYVPTMALHHRIPARRTSLGYLASINRGLGVSQSLADALVWEGDAGRWATASGRKLLQELVSLARLIVSVARGRSAAAEIPIQASFRVGRALGISRVLRMPSERRRELIGRARPYIRHQPVSRGAA